MRFKLPFIIFKYDFYVIIAIHINSNIVIPTGDSITVKSHDTSTRLSKESKEISDVCESKDHLEESSKKTALGNDHQEFGHAEAVGRKYCMW